MTLTDMGIGWMWLFWAAVFIVVAWILAHLFRSAVDDRSPETPEEFLERRRSEGESTVHELEKEWDRQQD